MCSTEPTGTGLRKSTSSRAVTAGTSSNQLECSEGLVERCAQQPAMRESRCALMHVGDLEDSMHTEIADHHPQMQTGGCFGPHA